MEFWTLQIYNTDNKSWYWLTEDFANTMHKVRKVIKDDLVKGSQCKPLGLKFFSSKISALKSLDRWSSYNDSGFHELRREIPFFKSLAKLKIKPVKINFTYQDEIKHDDIFLEIDLEKDAVMV